MEETFDPEVGLELVKLLLQVAYADDVVSAKERAVLVDAARRLAGEAGIAVVAAALDDKLPLPAPNMGLLGKHRGPVLKEVARLGAVDGINKDELDLVGTIGGMLR